MVKRYFRRLGYECYTDEELWIRARRYEGGFGKEEYPMPDVFAKKATQLVVAEVKKNTSRENVRDCIRKLTESLKFANMVYAAFSLSRPFSAKNVHTLSSALPECGCASTRPLWKRNRQRMAGCKESQTARPKEME